MSISWTPSKRKLRELIAWEKNPRQIKAAEAQRLRQSFDEFGQVQTLAISPNGEIYDGHQRKAVLELSENLNSLLGRMHYCRLPERPQRNINFLP